MPISKCTIKPAKILSEKEPYAEGHVQIWRELTEGEFQVGESSSNGKYERWVVDDSATERIRL
jgi:hypothetical protein